VNMILEKVKKSFEKPSRHGNYLESTAIRYDGYDLSNGQFFKSVIFFSIPFFALCALSASFPQESHPTRTLMQTHYRSEATESRDSRQAVCQLDGADERYAVHVPLNFGGFYSIEVSINGD
jgi:hypothetical protein